MTSHSDMKDRRHYIKVINSISFMFLTIIDGNSYFRISSTITKTCLYNFNPLKPQFYIVKLGFTGVYIIFLFLLKNINCGYSLEAPRRAGSNEYPKSMFWAEIWNISEFFFIWKFSVFGGIIFYIFDQACLRNWSKVSTGRNVSLRKHAYSNRTFLLQKLKIFR